MFQQLLQKSLNQPAPCLVANVKFSMNRVQHHTVACAWMPGSPSQWSNPAGTAHSGTTLDQEALAIKNITKGMPGSCTKGFPPSLRNDRPQSKLQFLQRSLTLLCTLIVLIKHFESLIEPYGGCIRRIEITRFVFTKTVQLSFDYMSEIRIIISFNSRKLSFDGEH